MAFGALANTAVTQRAELMEFAAKYIPAAKQPVAYFVLFGMIFGSTFAAVLAYILNPRALFKRKKAETPLEEPKNPEA